MKNHNNLPQIVKIGHSYVVVISNMYRKTILIPFFLTGFILLSLVLPVNSNLELNQDVVYTQPLGFYQVNTGDDLPPVNPLGVKEDQFGNIHTWYIIQSNQLFSLDNRLTLYYNIAYHNGSNFLKVISVEETSTTTFPILHKQELMETSAGEIYNIYVRSTDFGVSIVHMIHDPVSGVKFSTIQYGDAEITGPTIGPVITSNTIEYFVPILQGSQRKLFQITLVNGRINSTTSINFPTLDVEGANITMSEIFDITYTNESLYLLGSLPVSSGFHELHLVEKSLNGTYIPVANRADLNVAPVLSDVPFFSSIRQAIVKPELIATTDGNLYTYLFSLGEDVQINELAIWADTGTKNVFADSDENPFLISFLPTIYAIDNTVKIASIGVQIAQDIFNLAIDYFNYNTTSQELRRDKIQESSFSSGFFFFAMDFTSDDNLGMVGTISIPSYLKDKYKILNNTVGATFLFSNAELPEVDPYFNNVFVADDEVQTTKTRDNKILIITILTLITLSLVFVLYWRISRLNKIKIEGLEVDENYIQTSIIGKLANWLIILGIHLKSNWRRYFVTTLALIIPILLIFTLFTGLLSHQDYLIQTYEIQNPLNNAIDPDLPDSDFTWTRSLYNDEFANNTISFAQFSLAEQLTSSVIQRNGVDRTISNISTTTIFPLFEKRLGFFIENNENQSINYPFSHEVAVIDPRWALYFAENLIEGRLPAAPGEVVIHDGWYVEADLFSPRYDYGEIYDVGSEIEVYASELDIFLNSSVPELSQTLTVVGKVEKVENQPRADIESWAERLGTTVRGLRLLDQIPIYIDPFFGTDLLNSFSRLSLRPTSYVNLRYDVFSLERDEIPEVIENYEGMTDRTFQETGIPWLGEFVDDRIIDFLEGYFTASNNIQLEATVIVIPVLGLILLLNYEALGIGRSSLEEEIVRYKQQGMRSEKLLILFGFERFITTGVSVIVATVLTPSITPFTLSLTGFFQTNARSTPPLTETYLYAMSISVFVVLWLGGMILSQKYAINVEDWRYQRYVSGVKGDVIIIVVAGALIGLSFFITNVFEEQLNLTSPEDALNANIELIFLTIRMISLLLGTFGVVLIFSKLLNLIFIVSGKSMWKLKKSRVTLSFNGISSSMGIYGKLLVVFTISLFLIVPMVIVPQTLQAQYTTDAYADLGTDIIGTEWHTLSEETKNTVLNLQDIDKSTSYYFGILEFGNDLRIRTLAIDPSTFIDATVLPETYIESFGISPEDFEDIGYNEIITNTEFIDRNPIQIGDTIELGFPHIDETVEFNIKDSFSHFPVLKYELEGAEQSETIPLQMVISLDTLANLETLYNTNVTTQTSTIVEEINQRKIAIKVNGIANIDRIAAEIRTISGIRMTLLLDYIIEHQHPFFRIFEFISHLSIIVGLIAPILSTMIFSNILFERRKFELEVYKRNGLSNAFFIKQLSIEVVLASFIPSLAGLPLGSIWSAFYGIELFGQTFSQVVWVYNPSIIWIYTGLVLFSSMAIWILRIYGRTIQHMKEVRL